MEFMRDFKKKEWMDYEVIKDCTHDIYNTSTGEVFVKPVMQIIGNSQNKFDVSKKKKQCSWQSPKDALLHFFKVFVKSIWDITYAECIKMVCYTEIRRKYQVSA